MLATLKPSRVTSRAMSFQPLAAVSNYTNNTQSQFIVSTPFRKFHKNHRNNDGNYRKGNESQTIKVASSMLMLGLSFATLYQMKQNDQQNLASAEANDQAPTSAKSDNNTIGETAEEPTYQTG